MNSFPPLLLFAVAKEAAYDREILDAVTKVQVIHAVPTALVKAIIKRESDFNSMAVSKAGAIGLMQIMPQNAQPLGFTAEELFNSRKNILAGVRLVAALLKHYGGDLISTLVAYNARPREPFAHLPDNGETPHYVLAVLKYYHDYLSQPLRTSALQTQQHLRRGNHGQLGNRRSRRWKSRVPPSRQ